MDDVTRHPDDATLFDLVEGTLDAARAANVSAHLERCAACAAFVRAANAGAPETTSAVVAMPEQSAQRMQLRLAQEWRSRVASIADAEARADAAAAAVAVDAPLPDDDDLVPLRPDPAPAREGAPRRSWSRRLVPLLGIAVLAGLAGTSIWLGEQPGIEAGSADRETPTSIAGDAGEQRQVDGDGAVADEGGGTDVGASAGSGPAPGAADTSAERAEPDLASPQASTAQAPEVTDRELMDEDTLPPIGFEEFTPELCVVAFSDAQLVLPDGRIPQRIIDGPLGMYLVCG